MYTLPENMRYYRYANKDYLEFAEKHALFGTPPVQVIMQMYSEPLQKFRLAGQGLYDGPQPTSPVDAERLAKYFDPLPFWYEPLESQRITKSDYPFHAITQRPMMMYHSWDAQNAWLRQILSENFLYMNRATAIKTGLADLDWVWVTSPHSRIRCQLKTMEGVESNTVWTWNAIGKQAGAWGLEDTASEATAGFLMNHLISELLPRGAQDEKRLTNSDPVTGQAAWFDLRVNVTKCAAGETGIWPVFAPAKRRPHDDGPRPSTLRYEAD
jgi:sulfite dehydrogenase (quinone) subunit SoeA